MNFIKYRYLSFIFSGVLIAASLFSLIRFGLKPALDFTGGSLLEVKVPLSNVSTQSIRQSLGKANISVSQVQKTSSGTFLIRFKEGAKNEETILNELKSNYQGIENLRFETVGPTFGRELLNKALTALVVAVILILLFVAWQFHDKKFGICAILAMLHDNLVLLGSFSLLGHFLGIQVDALFLTAALTTLSGSVHDTVVTFDYIRKQTTDFSSQKEIEAIANKAINDTIVRNINNSMTIIFMLVATLLMGGETVKWFAGALLIGTIMGTYSSTFLAVPLLVEAEKMGKKK